MPNPFPGMNPYLENRTLWPDVHASLIYNFRSELARNLPNGFIAKMEQRLYIAGDNRNFQPDVFAVAQNPVPSPGSPTGSGTAVASKLVTIPITGIRVSFESVQVRERFIEIRTRDSRDTLIAVIEILSPSNKDDERGRLEYLRKQRAVLDSTAHLLEVDLLRGGKWALAPQEAETRRVLDPFDYLVSLHQGGYGEVYNLWPISLRNSLPTVQVPLTVEAGAVSVNLQAVLEHAYDDADYDRQIDYSLAPDPPLSPADTIWAQVLLQEKGRD